MTAEGIGAVAAIPGRARPETGVTAQVVDKFADEGARNNFKASAQYREWMSRLGELTAEAAGGTRLGLEEYEVSLFDVANA